MTYTNLETGKVMESYQYSYDKNSNIIEKIAVNNYPKEDSDKVNETKAYTYDTLGRLTKTVTTDHKKDDKTKTVTYTYDNVGNRLKEDDGTTTISYTYNGLDQLKTFTKEKGTAVEEVRQYDYDANGNQTDVKNTKTGENQTYVYDAENRLSQVSVTKDGKISVIQQNTYNGEGQRIQKIDGDEMTNYYYQDGVAAYTTDADGSQNSQNLIGTEGNVGAVAGSYKGRLVAKRLGYKGKKRNLFIATYVIKGAVVGAIIGAFAGYGIGVAMGASSSSGLAVKGVNSAIRRVASDQNKVRHIMQSKHVWTNGSYRKN